MPRGASAAAASMNDGGVVSAIDPARRIPKDLLGLAEALLMCESSRMGRSPAGCLLGASRV